MLKHIIFLLLTGTTLSCQKEAQPPVPVETEVEKKQPDSQQPNSTPPADPQPDKTPPQEKRPNGSQPDGNSSDETKPNNKPADQDKPTDKPADQDKPNHKQPNETKPNETQPTGAQPRERPTENPPSETPPQAAPEEWHSLAEKATRFPYYPHEPEPRDSRACHDDWMSQGEAGTLYFVAVADSSMSPLLWAPGLEQCRCQDGGETCPGPSCEKDMCGRKIKIRCISNECLPKYRHQPIVVMIRDVCPVKHAQNRGSGHCQGGDHIDIYRDLYQKLTNKGTDGANLELEFAAASQDAPLGFVEVNTEAITPSEIKVGGFTCQEQKDFGKCDQEWMTPVCDEVCGR